MMLKVDERKQLAAALGTPANDIDQSLERIQQAGAAEYIDMFLGRHTLHRVEEIRQYRLFLLIHHLFDDRIPTEDQVGRLFQITPTQARALIRGTVAAFRYQLTAAIKATLAGPIRDAEQVSDDVWETLMDQQTLDTINHLLADSDLSLTRVTRKPDSVGVCRIPAETMTVLKKQLL